MKTSLFKITLIPLCLFLFSTQCEEDIIPISQENDQKELALLKAEIEKLVSTSSCGDTFECKFMGFGSKPCGGYWSYLVYSTSIDTKQLESMVDDYNQLETIYNMNWNLASDCAIISPPTNISCENNTCVAVY